MKVKNNTNEKTLNNVFILTALISCALLPLKIWWDLKSMPSPFLPKYTVFYINGSLINIACFLLGGLIPSVFLRWRKAYTKSTICLVLFFGVGYFLRFEVKIYEHFYWIVSY